MGGLLRQGTAATVMFGPLLDAADGITAETALTMGTTKIRMSLNGGAFASPVSTGAHVEEGYFTFGASSSEVATLGRWKLKVNDTEAMPFFDDYMVVPPDVYDAIVAGSDHLTVTISSTGRADLSTDIWAKAVRTLTGDVTIASTSRADLTTDIWSRGVRTITGDVTITSTSRADLTTDVWSRGVRTVTEVGGNVTGSVASVSGAVASVTADVTIASTSRADLTTDIWSRAVRSVTSVAGDVTGNVDGSVGSVTGAVGSVSGAVASVTADVTIASTSRADLTTDIWSRGVRLVTGVAGDVTGNLDGNVGGNVAGNITGALGTVSSTGLDDIWDEAVDGTVTARQSLRLNNSVAGAKVSGGGTATITIRDLADTKDRIVATVSTDGDRTAVTRTLT